MAGSNTPLCDAINEQFDEWDVEILVLREKLKSEIESDRKWAEEKLKSLAQDIEKWVKKQFDGLGSGGENPFEGISEDISMENIIDNVKKMAKAINKIIKIINTVLGDVTMAPIVLTQRSAQTMALLVTGG